MDNQSQTTAPQTQPQPHPSGTSEDTKTIVTILLLIFVFPVGLIMMWVWPKWKTWVKILVTALSVIPALLFLGFIGIIAAGMLIAINPKEQFEKARQLQLTPTPQIKNQTTNTSNWKKYSYSYFSIRLPSDWEVYQTTNPIQFVNYNVNSASRKGFDPTLDKGKLKIEVYRTDIGDSLRNYLDLQKQQTTNWTETKMKVNGLPAIKVKTSNPGFVVYTQSSTNERIISIAFALDFDNYSSLADQIIESFQFTE